MIFRQSDKVGVGVIWHYSQTILSSLVSAMRCLNNHIVRESGN